MCGNLPLRVIGRGDYSGGCHISCCISSSLHSLTISTSVSVSRDRSFSAACPTSTANQLCSAVLLTGSFLAVLIGVWAPRPVATCQRFSSHIYRSAPAAFDRSPPRLFWLLFFLSLAVGSTFVLFIFSCYPSNCSLQCRGQLTDSRLMHKNIHLHRFTQNVNYTAD